MNDIITCIYHVAAACRPKTVLITQDNPAYDYVHNIMTQKNTAYEDIIMKLHKNF